MRIFSPLGRVESCEFSSLRWRLQWFLRFNLVANSRAGYHRSALWGRNHPLSRRSERKTNYKVTRLGGLSLRGTPSVFPGYEVSEFMRNVFSIHMRFSLRTARQKIPFVRACACSILVSACFPWTRLFASGAMSKIGNGDIAESSTVFLLFFEHVRRMLPRVVQRCCISASRLIRDHSRLSRERSRSRFLPKIPWIENILPRIS